MIFFYFIEFIFIFRFLFPFLFLHHFFKEMSYLRLSFYIFVTLKGIKYLKNPFNPYHFRIEEQKKGY